MAALLRQGVVYGFEQCLFVAHHPVVKPTIDSGIDKAVRCFEAGVAFLNAIQNTLSYLRKQEANLREALSSLTGIYHLYTTEYLEKITIVQDSSQGARAKDVDLNVSEGRSTPSEDGEEEVFFRGSGPQKVIDSNRETKYVHYHWEKRILSEEEFLSFLSTSNFIQSFRFSTIIRSPSGANGISRLPKGIIIEVYSGKGSGFNYRQWSKIPGNQNRI